MYADNCAMQLCSRPKQFDVILGSNLFGDLLSDLAAALTGSLGMLPSATLGAVDATTGKRHALYEPVHGSAPDIAGKGIANPCAQILSFAMLLRWSFGMEEDAALLETAVEKVLAGGLRTADIMQTGMARVGTSVMGEAVMRELEKLTGLIDSGGGIGGCAAARPPLFRRLAAKAACAPVAQLDRAPDYESGGQEFEISSGAPFFPKISRVTRVVAPSLARAGTGLGRNI